MCVDISKGILHFQCFQVQHPWHGIASLLGAAIESTAALSTCTSIIFAPPAGSIHRSYSRSTNTLVSRSARVNSNPLRVEFAWRGFSCWKASVRTMLREGEIKKHVFSLQKPVFYVCHELLWASSTEDRNSGLDGRTAYHGLCWCGYQGDICIPIQLEAVIGFPGAGLLKGWASVFLKRALLAKATFDLMGKQSILTKQNHPN